MILTGKNIYISHSDRQIRVILTGKNIYVSHTQRQAGKG